MTRVGSQRQTPPPPKKLQGIEREVADWIDLAGDRQQGVGGSEGCIL